MDYEQILYTVAADEHLARVTLNRPDKRNPLSPALLGEVAHALGRARDDAAVRVVILTGAGQAFSAGGDLAAMGQSQQNGLTSSFVDLNLLIARLGKPVIAMVNGPALAGGFGLMLSCHLVVAADTAVFGTPEINVGLWPMTIMAVIFRNVGRKPGMELILTGEKIDAAAALRLGLVNRVVPAARLEAETLALAASLAAKSPAVMKLGLDAFAAAADLALEPALRHLEQQFFALLGTEDAKEGLTAFLQKRAPVWKGK
ncbi:MAG TPA: enoyl-CoA hydratase-related protein [Polyangia bacterium]|jgi:enoyl-CoA hydratase/carnithine racemase